MIVAEIVADSSQQPRLSADADRAVGLAAAEPLLRYTVAACRKIRESLLLVVIQHAVPRWRLALT